MIVQRTTVGNTATLFVVLLITASLGMVFARAVMGTNDFITSNLLLIVPGLIVGCWLLRPVLRELFVLWKSMTWWHVSWLVLFFSGLVFRTRELYEQAENPVDSWAIYRIALVGLIAAVLALQLGLRKHAWLQSLFTGLPGILAIYTLVCAVTTIWSVFPAWTLYKSMEYLVDVALMAAALVMVRSVAAYRSMLDWTWILFGSLLAWIWIGSFIWPEEAWRFNIGTIGLQLAGVWPAVSSNSVGEYGAIVAIVGLTRLLVPADDASRRRWYMLLVAFGLVSLFYSQTRSAIAGFFAGLILVLFYSNSKRLMAGAVLVVIIVSTTGVAQLFSAYLRRGQNPEMLLTLTGRVRWWRGAWDKLQERPLTGHGAYAAGKFVVLTEMREEAGGLHSDWAELAVGASVWGLIPFLMALLGTWRSLLRHARDALADPAVKRMTIESLGVLAILTCRSFFGANLTWHAPLPYLVVLGCAEILNRHENRRAV